MDGLLVFQVSQVALHAHEIADRWRAWRAARVASNQIGRPLLNVGCASTRVITHPCGDVCLDVDSRRLQRCRGVAVVGDVRSIPYPDGYFGAALVCHVLEHLPSVADAEIAVRELHRVARVVYVCSPGRLLLVNWLVPDHHLWVDNRAGRLEFSERHRSDEIGHHSLSEFWARKDSLEIRALTLSGGTR